MARVLQFGQKRKGSMYIHTFEVIVSVFMVGSAGCSYAFLLGAKKHRELAEKHAVIASKQASIAGTCCKSSGYKNCGGCKAVVARYDIVDGGVVCMNCKGH